MFKKIAVLAIVGFAFVATSAMAQCPGGPECVSLWTSGGVDQDQHEFSEFTPINNTGGQLTNDADQNFDMWAAIGGDRGGDKTGIVNIIGRQGQTLETVKGIPGGTVFVRDDEYQEGTLNLEGTRGSAWGNAATDADGLVGASGMAKEGGLSMGSVNRNTVNADAILCATRNGDGTLNLDALNENGHDQELNTPDSSGRTFSYTGVRNQITLGVNNQ